MGTRMRRRLLLLLYVYDSIHAFHIQQYQRLAPHRSALTSIFAINDKEELQEPTSTTRRHVLSTSAGSIAATVGLASWPQLAHASGLVRFPCTEPLGNTYHFLRAGTSLLEAEDIWSTNPLFVTNREAALSDEGVDQVEVTIDTVLKINNINPSIVRYSIAASSTDTCNLVARDLKMTRDRLVPEFNYLEPRAIGAWDMLSISDTTKAVWAMDVVEGGSEGTGGRPPPNEDGTPHETLANVAIRLRQLISVMETQYSGDDVLVVACDGTTLALLSCMIAGIPYNRVHEMEFAPGEVRLDVNMESTLALWKEKQTNLGSYQKLIEEGTIELQRLREMKDIVSLKDQKFDEEQLEIEAETQRRQVLNWQREEDDKKARLARAQKISDENGGTSPVLNPMAIGGVGIGFLGVAVAVGGGTEDDTGGVSTSSSPTTSVEDPAIQMTAAPEAQQEELEMRAPSVPQEERVFDPVLDGVEKSSNPLPWVAPADVLSKIEETVSGRSVSVENDEEPMSGDDKKVVDPAQAAAEAMEEYLNQDDGGEEWLQIMAQMVESNYDDDDV